MADQVSSPARERDFDVLRQRLPSGDVLTDPDSLELYGEDIGGDAGSLLAVVRPGNTETLIAAVRFAAEQGIALVPRGGGMSYSGGYVCPDEPALCVDLGAMDQVLEVNTQDMYVTVEAGCTWRRLHETLEPMGVRTPFWGTLSGLVASIGGGLSQNSLFWGSGRHGSAADSVVGFEVVLAGGEVLRTGVGAQAGSAPFFRHYGPDLTGLFTCDNGALGIKAKVTLKLIPAVEGRALSSFAFADHADLIRAMSEVSRQRLADACFAFDPALQRQRMKRESLIADVKALGNVVAKQGGVLRGLREGLRTAVAGRGFLDEDSFSVHFVIEEATLAAAEAGARRIAAICAEAGGHVVENSVPKIARANPFGPLNSMVGPGGERWLPVHGLLPHSKARAAFEAVEDLFERNKAILEAHAIQHGTLITFADTNCFVIEPVFYWPDRLNALHRHTVDDAVLAKFTAFPDNPAARAEVMRLRGEIVALFGTMGAAHLQIGRLYPYLGGLETPPRYLLEAIKDHLDPEGRMNPGALGL